MVSARELSMKEIKEIRANIPDDLEIETFVHGAMCISYSGRCLLSNYFTGRDANQGACTHPCRWKYAVMEESRPGEYLPVYENERGTYIFNSKDLCMIEPYSGAHRCRHRQLQDRRSHEDRSLCGHRGSEPTGKPSTIISKTRFSMKKICPGIWIRFPTAPTGSLPRAFFMVSRTARPRSTTATPM